jgi:hypothetical protein
MTPEPFVGHFGERLAPALDRRQAVAHAPHDLAGADARFGDRQHSAWIDRGPGLLAGRIAGDSDKALSAASLHAHIVSGEFWIGIRVARGLSAATPLSVRVLRMGRIPSG